MCNHDCKDEHNTLTILNMMRMTYPRKYVVQCTECGEVFTVNDVNTKMIHCKKEN